jgi:hypothetical protein
MSQASYGLTCFERDLNLTRGELHPRDEVSDNLVNIALPNYNNALRNTGSCYGKIFSNTLFQDIRALAWFRSAIFVKLSRVQFSFHSM